MVKNQISSILESGKRLILSDTARTIAQLLCVAAVFALLYLFLITGFALGMTM